MARGLLAPRWAAQQPHSNRRRYFWHTEPAGFGAASPPSAGQARSTQGRGAAGRFFWKLRSGRREYYRTFVARRLLVASGLAPRWAAQQPHSNRRRYFWHTAPAGFGAASPPSAGQARSPQGRGGSRSGFFGHFAAGGGSTTGFLWPAGFLWRAGLPRAGWRSRPNKPTPVSPGTPRKQALGRLRHPTGDKPPLHISPTAARAPVVASGLAPRWAAQQPHSRRRRYFRHTEPAGFGAASPPSAGQARSPQGGV
ncbi:hypothetical protein EDF80_1044 [Pseudomonas brenneri]|nr:hypothetical protein EDF80_1044 [Pseudomonas brenneri]